jgi:hypothetical protein
MAVGGKGQHGSATTSWAPYLGPREIAAAVEIMTSKLCAIEISDLNWIGLDWTALHCSHCLNLFQPRLTLTFGPGIVIGQGSPNFGDPLPTRGMH